MRKENEKQTTTNELFVTIPWTAVNFLLRLMNKDECTTYKFAIRDRTKPMKKTKIKTEKRPSDSCENQRN